jgi:cell division inhibitor SepF
MAASAGPLTKLVRWFSGYDETEDGPDVDDTTEPTTTKDQPRKHQRERGPLVLQDRDNVAMQIRHPRTLEDRMLVGMDLKQRRTVTLDLTRLPDADARYFFEFVLGVIYALDATAEKVTEGIYLLIPRGVSFNNDQDAGDAPAATERPATPVSRSSRAAGSATRNDGQEELFWHGG